MPIAQLDRASVSGTDDSGSTPDRHMFWWHIQVANATEEKKTSFGVKKFKHFFGLLFIQSSSCWICSFVILSKLVCFGNITLISPLVFSIVPFCQLQ